MENGTGINMGEEFATLDFNSSRLEKRFVKTMDTLGIQAFAQASAPACLAWLPV